MVAGEQPILIAATSGRSKCKACVYLGGADPTITMGSQRVGLPGHAAGVTVYHWCHPACFATHCLRVDYAPTGAAKCKADGGTIAKGAIRLLLGHKKEATKYSVENAYRTIIPQLIALLGRDKVTLQGLETLSLDDRARAESFVFEGAGRGTSTGGHCASNRAESSKKARQPAAAKPCSKPAASKRARPVAFVPGPTAKPGAKNARQKKKAVMEEGDEFEICD
uniref:PARP-type domain-containing protein n=1 Tax=Coccolithus braarudii TaxID=221442 RepID=A0A7S0LBW0_9EUKA|mmetsp:Transcript_29476/g.63445  ORF Transcript_29476/g.63445 Transcript_29476/m.63445 type:complete len:223 (+) Transcript_29476:56-724(+)